jgi:hypothetical protein
MSAFESVTKLAKQWRPQPFPTELKYRDSLCTYLRERLPEAKVEKEYRHIGTTIDIYVKVSGFFGPSEVFVELKRNLLQKREYDRLVGQIESLQPGKNAIVAILCGKINPALVTRFKEKYKNADKSPWVSLRLVVKEDAGAAVKSKGKAVGGGIRRTVERRMFDYRIIPDGTAVVLVSKRATKRGEGANAPAGSARVFRTRHDTADFVRKSEAEGFTFEGKEFIVGA